MPQKTNLNINPYYDDFKKSNNYYRVLYKPGHPIQARELTTSQSTHKYHRWQNNYTTENEFVQQNHSVLDNILNFVNFVVTGRCAVSKSVRRRLQHRVWLRLLLRSWVTVRKKKQEIQKSNVYIDTCISCVKRTL